MVNTIPRGRLAQNTLLSLFWQGMRVLFLAVWIIGLARLLGAEGYGTYSGIAGIAIALGSFSGLGLGLLLYQDAVIDPELFDQRWSDALWTTILSGALFAVIFLAIGFFVFPDISMLTLVAVGITELVFYPMMTTSAFAFASRHKIGWSSAVPALAAFFRCISIALFALSGAQREIDSYVWFHLFATATSSVMVVLLVNGVLKPEPRPYNIKTENLRKGLRFCLSWASTNALTSADKTLVLKIGGGEMAGLYSSSFRFASIFMLPIDALVNAATPKLFLQGAKKHDSSPVIKYVFIALVAYSVVAGCALITLPEFIIWMLGPSFAAAEQAIKWLSLLIPCYAMRVFSTQILLTSGHVRIKVIAEFGGLCLLLLLGFLLIPAYGLFGAALMLIATEAVVALICWFAITKNSYLK